MISKEEFIKGEALKMSWLDKLTKIHPEINTTRTLSGDFKNMQPGEEMVIRPSRLYEAIVLCILPVAIYFWVFLLRLLLQYRFQLVISLLAFLMLSFVICMLAWNLLFDKKYSYTIRINSDAISIHKNKFYWADIAETCIMRKQSGRAIYNYLVLFRKDGTVETFNLSRFTISDKKLSRIIEHYKHSLRP